MKVERETRTAPISTHPRANRWQRVGKILLILGLILAVLLGAGVVVMWKFVNNKFNATHRDIVLDPLPPGQAYNVLVLGSDRRSVVEGSTAGQYQGGAGQRSDTIMLVHIAKDGQRAVVLSFPRDLRVQIPGYRGYNKINAAYSFGGPNLIISTVKQLTGLAISHYVEVNFESFRKIVDAVGGLRMCVGGGIYDRRSGLLLPKAGCYNFDGDLALSFVRERYQDPRGDFGRIERQQLFMRTLMSKVTSAGTLVNVPRLVSLISAVSEGVITDRKLQLAEVRGIANRLAGFKQSNVDFRVLPSYPQYIGGVAYVLAKPEAQAIYDALGKDLPLPEGAEYGKTAQSLPVPADVTVNVMNGTMTPGLARTVAARLRSLGYRVRKVGDYVRRDYKTTTILFAPGLDIKARLLQGDLPGSAATESVAVHKVDIVLIVGADASRATPSP